MVELWSADFLSFIVSQYFVSCYPVSLFCFVALGLRNIFISVLVICLKKSRIYILFLRFVTDAESVGYESVMKSVLNCTSKGPYFTLK